MRRSEATKGLFLSKGIVFLVDVISGAARHFEMWADTVGHGQLLLRIRRQRALPPRRLQLTSSLFPIIASATAADYLNGPGIDNKLRQTVGGTASYFLTDQQGTMRAFADASGNVASTLDYESFGNVISGSASTRYTYTGRESDSDTGLMYYRARWYDPAQGRFISEDPIGFDAETNFYNYVGNNPTNFTDPLGLCPTCTVELRADPVLGIYIHLYIFTTDSESGKTMGFRAGPNDQWPRRIEAIGAP